MGEFIEIAELLFGSGYELVSYRKYYDQELHRYAVDIKVFVSPGPPSPVEGPPTP